MATNTQQGDDLFRQAISAWESAVESGVKMQEESAKWLREMFCNSDSLSQWYSKGQSAASETMTKVQENISDAIRMMNQQAESSVKLMQKAVDARQSDTGADTKKMVVQWWETAMESMRTNSQAILQANSRMLSTWAELARKIQGDAADTMTHLAQKTAEQAEKMATSAAEHAKDMVRQATKE